MSKLTVKALEKKFRDIETKMNKEVEKTNTPESKAYVKQVTEMMNQTLQTFERMSSNKGMFVAEKEFDKMLERISNGKPTPNREQRRSKQPKVNIR